MRPRSTLVLAALLGLCVLYIVKIDLPEQEAKQSQTFLFGKTKPADFAKIRIKNKQGDFTLLNVAEAKNEGKDGAANRWELAEPQGAKVEAASAQNLVSALQDLKTDNQVPPEDVSADVGVYGLKDPEVVIDVHFRQKSEPVTVELGNKNEYVFKRYLKTSGEDKANIYLVPESIYTAASKSKFDFRDKSPVTVSDAEIEKIRFSNSEGKSFSAVKEDKDWKLIEPIKANASDSSISDLLRNLRNVKAVDFVDSSDKEALGFNSPLLELELAGQKPESIFKVALAETSGVENKLYMALSNDGTVYVVNEEVKDKLTKTLMDVREKQLCDFNPYEVLSAKVVVGEKETQFLREGESWKVDGKPGDEAFVNQYFRDLGELKAIDFPTPQADGLGFDQATLKAIVSLKTLNGEKQRTILVGSKAETKGYYAGCDDLSEPFIISDFAYEQIKPRPEALQITSQPSPLPSGSESPSAAN